MRFSLIIGATLLGSIATAVPFNDLESRNNEGRGGFCLTDYDAARLSAGFASLLTNFSNKTANEILTPDFQDFSSSINFLVGADLNGVTFPSRLAFELGQGAQRPIPFQILSPPSWHSCTQVFFRWVSALGAEPVYGINVMQIVSSGGCLKISVNWSEFDSGAWVNDIGGTCTPPPPPPQ